MIGAVFWFTRMLDSPFYSTLSLLSGRLSKRLLFFPYIIVICLLHNSHQFHTEKEFCLPALMLMFGGCGDKLVDDLLGAYQHPAFQQTGDRVNVQPHLGKTVIWICRHVEKGVIA